MARRISGPISCSVRRPAWNHDNTGELRTGSPSPSSHEPDGRETHTEKLSHTSVNMEQVRDMTALDNRDGVRQDSVLEMRMFHGRHGTRTNPLTHVPVESTKRHTPSPCIVF